MKTLIIDIDGTLVKSFDGLNRCMEHAEDDDILLPGVREKLEQWFMANNNIIIMTGRPECYREQTVNQLKRLNIWYDQLIMGVKHCERHLINDGRPDGIPSAVAHILKKNEGMENLDI